MESMRGVCKESGVYCELLLRLGLSGGVSALSRGFEFGVLLKVFLLIISDNEGNLLDLLQVYY